jgi:hypothetical protein
MIKASLRTSSTAIRSIERKYLLLITSEAVVPIQLKDEAFELNPVKELLSFKE